MNEVCGICGALIADQAKHYAWHNTLADTIRKITHAPTDKAL